MIFNQLEILMFILMNCEETLFFVSLTSTIILYKYFLTASCVEEHKDKYKICTCLPDRNNGKLHKQNKPYKGIGLIPV